MFLSNQLNDKDIPIIGMRCHCLRGWWSQVRVGVNVRNTLGQVKTQVSNFCGYPIGVIDNDTATIQVGMKETVVVRVGRNRSAVRKENGCQIVVVLVAVVFKTTSSLLQQRNQGRPCIVYQISELAWFY